MKVLITDKINETAKNIIDEVAQGEILPTMIKVLSENKNGKYDKSIKNPLNSSAILSTLLREL